jgi:hypothetical protein
MKPIPLSVGLLFVSLFLASCASVDQGAADPGPAETAAPTAAAVSGSSRSETIRADHESKDAIVPYPFTTCAVIRRDFKGAPKYRRVYQNHEVLFCCTPCLNAFDTNPDPYMPRIIEAAAAKARGEEVNSGW